MTSNARQGFVTAFVLLTTACLTAFVGAARGQTCGDERFVVELSASIYPEETDQPYSFVAIHLEHYNTKSKHSQSFNALDKLVGKADALTIPLTIMFHQSWIDWLKDTGSGGGSAHADTVKSWFDPNRTPVHEPGIHNHGPTHQAQWQSGWTEWEVCDESPPPSCDPLFSRAQDLNDHFVTKQNFQYDYLADPVVGYPAVEGTQGPIRTVKDEIEMFLNLNEGDIVSGTVMVPWHEAPEAYAVSQRRHGAPPDELSGRNHRLPKVTAFNGQASHDQYLFIGTQFPAKNNPDDADQAILKMQVEDLWNTDFAGLEPENIYGLVFHAHNYKPTGIQAGARCNIDVWLETLNLIDADNSAGKRKTMRAIMDNVVFPTDYSYDGFPGDGFCDALEACGDDPPNFTCTSPDIQLANPYDDDFDGTKSHWGMLTHSSPLDCGLTDGDGDNLKASGTGRGSTLRHAGRAYQAEGEFFVTNNQGAVILDKDGAQGGKTVRLDSNHQTIEYDLTTENFMDRNDNSGGSFEITAWQVRIRSLKFGQTQATVAISIWDSGAGDWASPSCTGVALSDSTSTWHESTGCRVSWAGMTDRKLQIARENQTGGAHVDAVLLRPDPVQP